MLPAAATTTAATAGTAAVGSTAFWTGAAAAAPITATTVVPSILVSSTPSFLGSLSSMYATIKPLMGPLSVIGQGAQALNAISAGKTQAKMYDLQNLQMQVKLDNDRLNYRRQANDVFRKLLATNSAALARGYSGGVLGLEGSTADIMTINEKYAGEDLAVIAQNIQTGKTFGEAQSAMITAASEKAVTGSYYDALASIGKAGYLYETLRTG